MFTRLALCLEPAVRRGNTRSTRDARARQPGGTVLRVSGAIPDGPRKSGKRNRTARPTSNALRLSALRAVEPAGRGSCGACRSTAPAAPHAQRAPQLPMGYRPDGKARMPADAAGVSNRGGMSRSHGQSAGFETASPDAPPSFVQGRWRTDSRLVLPSPTGRNRARRPPPLAASVSR
jgi:hypothetical protein